MANSMKNLADFEKKYPDLYAAIFDLGKEAGIGEAPGSKADGLFERTVQDYTAQGLGKSEAIRKAVSENPDAHKDYLSRLKTNKASKFRTKPSAEFERFEDAVAHFLSHGQGSKAAAINAAVSQYPQLHADYIARLKRGEQGVLLCRS